MKVLRSLARSLLSALDFSPKPRRAEPPVPSRLHDGFERAYRSAIRQPTHLDGFDGGVRRPPVDLTGGLKAAAVLIDELPPAPVLPPSDFVASLDDLALLTESPAEAQPPEPTLAEATANGLISLEDVAPLLEAAASAPPDDGPKTPEAPAEHLPRPAGPARDGLLAPEVAAHLSGVPGADVLPPPEAAAQLAPAAAPAADGLHPPHAESRQAPEASGTALPAETMLTPATPLAQPAPALAPEPVPDGLLTLDAFGPVVDAFEPATPGPVAPSDGLLSLDAFGPVVDAFEPAVPVAQPRARAAPAPAPRPQHTVDLLMPAARPVEAPRPAVGQFSTVELFAIVDELVAPAEAPEKQDPGPVVEAAPEGSTPAEALERQDPGPADVPTPQGSTEPRP